MELDFVVEPEARSRQTVRPDDLDMHALMPSTCDAWRHAATGYRRPLLATVPELSARHQRRMKTLQNPTGEGENVRQLQKTGRINRHDTL